MSTENLQSFSFLSLDWYEVMFFFLQYPFYLLLRSFYHDLLPVRDYRSVKTLSTCPHLCLQSCWTGFHPSAQCSLRPLDKASMWGWACTLGFVILISLNVIMVTLFALQISKADRFIFFFPSCPQKWKQYNGWVIFALSLSEDTSCLRGPTWHNGLTSVDITNVVPHLAWGQWTWGVIWERETEVIRSQSLGGPSPRFLSEI